MSVTIDFELLTILGHVQDPRRLKSTTHRLVDVLFVALCGSIAGCDTWPEIVSFAQHRLEWFRRFVPLEAGIPSDDTFRRVFAMLDTGRFAACLLAWTKSLEKATAGRVIAIDGKTLRNSFDEATGKKALHLVSAWSTENHLVLAQVATDEKSNEITAIPKLLELLDLNGAVVTIDAMGCQLEIAEKIVELGGDYVLTLKGNQPTMHEKAAALFEEACSADALPKDVKRMVMKERRRAADEIREHLVMPAPKDFADERWGIHSLGMVCRRRIESDGSETGQVRYYISSLRPLVRPLAYAVRSHWGIENTLHWTLDVTFSEDKSRTRAGNVAETTALLRRVALSKLQQDTWEGASLRIRRKSAGWSTERLEQILAGNPR